MKRILLITAGIFFFLKVIAQPDYFSVANQQGFYSITNKVIQATPHKYLTIGNYFNYSNGGIGPFLTNAHIGCVADDNTILWNITPQFGYEHSDISDIIKTADGNFIYVGHAEACDIANFGVIFMGKIDSSGASLWSKTYQYVSFYKSNQHVAELPNGELLLTVDSSIIFCNNVGDSLASIDLSGGDINCIKLTPDNFLLFGCKKGFIKTDLNVIPVLTGFPYIDIKNLLVASVNQYVFSSSDVFYQTDNLFNSLDSVQLSNWYDDITGICPFGNNYLLTAHISGSSFYDVVFIDGAFNQIPAVWIQSSQWIISDIIPRDSGFVIAGDEKTFEGQHCFVKSYDSNFQTAAESYDAGVVDVKTDSMIAVWTGSIYNISFNAYATVRNFGPDTIHDFTANIYLFEFFSICLPKATSVSVHNVNLAPQDTLSVYMGTFYHQFLLSPPQPYYLCLFSSSPGNHLDSNHSNDKFCKSIPVTYVGIKENSPLTNLQISPNPSTESLQINIPELKEAVNISLSDISGKEIMHDMIEKTNTTLSLTQINPGMYFLKFNFGNQSLIKKIIKQ